MPPPARTASAIEPSGGGVVEDAECAAPASFEVSMIKWAMIFAVVAPVVAVLGFGGLAGAAIEIARLLFWLAVIVAVALFVLGFTIYRKIT